MRSPTTRTLFILALIIGVALPAVAQDSGEYGTESRAAEERAKRPWYHRMWGFWRSDEEEPDVAKPAEMAGDVEVGPFHIPDAPGPQQRVSEVNFTGDAHLLEQVTSRIDGSHSLADQFRALVVGKALSEQQAAAVCKQFTHELIARKYLLSGLMSRGISNGVWTVHVNSANFGDVGLYEEVPAEESGGLPGERFGVDGNVRAFRGRWYSSEQIRDRLAFGTEPFNYTTFYDRLYGLSVHPDLELGSVLRVEPAEPAGREVDVDLLVDERVPAHVAFQLDNYGTDGIGEWRGSVTGQYLNLTQNWDVLSLEYLQSTDGELKAGSASYYRPLPWHDMELTVYAGISDLDASDVEAYLDLEGEGWFLGFQLAKPIWETRDHQLKLTAGWTHRRTETVAIIGPVNFNRDVTTSPINVGLDYRSKRPDQWDGRDFASYSFYINRAGWLTSDGDDEFNAFRFGAEGDYTIHRASVGRLQYLPFGSETAKWSLFFEADGQYSPDSLVSPEQVAIGGANTVRGFEERALLADRGYSATVELRTPILDRRLFTAVSEDWKAQESLQFLVFADYGYVENDDPIPGELDDGTLGGAGAGFRLGILENFQLRFDYGWQFEDEDMLDEDDDGRAHVAAQLQF